MINDTGKQLIADAAMLSVGDLLDTLDDAEAEEEIVTILIGLLEERRDKLRAHVLEKERTQ